MSTLHIGIITNYTCATSGWGNLVTEFRIRRHLPIRGATTTHHTFPQTDCVNIRKQKSLEKPPPAVPITQNNPSGGANNRGGHKNREPRELRCVKCSRPAEKCQNRCDPGNQIKFTPGKSGRTDHTKVCGNCGLIGHHRGDCAVTKEQGEVFWKQRRQFIAKLPPLDDDHGMVLNPYAQASLQHVQQPIQSQGSVGNGQSVIQETQGVYP